eukprot:Rmarinus@m.29287
MPSAYLHGIDGDLPLNKSRSVIGRDSECDIQLKSRSVSSKHAAIVFGCLPGSNIGAGHTAALVDLGSLNGTFVNDTLYRKGKTVRLNHGDTIRFGYDAMQYTFMLGNVPPTPGKKSPTKGRPQINSPTFAPVHGKRPKVKSRTDLLALGLKNSRQMFSMDEEDADDGGLAAYDVQSLPDEVEPNLLESQISGGYDPGTGDQLPPRPPSRSQPQNQHTPSPAPTYGQPSPQPSPAPGHSYANPMSPLTLAQSGGGFPDDLNRAPAPREMFRNEARLNGPSTQSPQDRSVRVEDMKKFMVIHSQIADIHDNLCGIDRRRVALESHMKLQLRRRATDEGSSDDVDTDVVLLQDSLLPTNSRKVATTASEGVDLSSLVGEVENRLTRVKDFACALAERMVNVVQLYERQRRDAIRAGKDWPPPQPGTGAKTKPSSVSTKFESHSDHIENGDDSSKENSESENGSTEGDGEDKEKTGGSVDVDGSGFTETNERPVTEGNQDSNGLEETKATIPEKSDDASRIGAKTSDAVDTSPGKEPEETTVPTSEVKEALELYCIELTKRVEEFEAELEDLRRKETFIPADTKELHERVNSLRGDLAAKDAQLQRTLRELAHALASLSPAAGIPESRRIEELQKFLRTQCDEAARARREATEMERRNAAAQRAWMDVIDRGDRLQNALNAIKRKSRSQEKMFQSLLEEKDRKLIELNTRLAEVSSEGDEEKMEAARYLVGEIERMTQELRARALQSAADDFHKKNSHVTEVSPAETAVSSMARAIARANNTLGENVNDSNSDADSVDGVLPAGSGTHASDRERRLQNELEELKRQGSARRVADLLTEIERLHVELHRTRAEKEKLLRDLLSTADEPKSESNLPRINMESLGEFLSTVLRKKDRTIIALKKQISDAEVRPPTS